jgi:hypothetical protein
MGGSSPARLVGTFSGPEVTLTGCQDKSFGHERVPKIQRKKTTVLYISWVNYSQCAITSYKLGSRTFGLHAWFNILLAFTYTACTTPPSVHSMTKRTSWKRTKRQHLPHMGLTQPKQPAEFSLMMKRHSMSYINLRSWSFSPEYSELILPTITIPFAWSPYWKHCRRVYENLEHKKWLLCKNISRSKNTPTT